MSTKPVQLPLRILVIVSSPEGALLLDTEEEIGVIQDALDEAQRAGRVQVEYLDDAIPPAERVHRAAQLISGKRYLFIFDNWLFGNPCG